jgi:hypothetical protein
MVTSRMSAAHSLKTKAPLEATANREAVIDHYEAIIATLRAQLADMRAQLAATRASNGPRGTPPSPVGL